MLLDRHLFFEDGDPHHLFLGPEFRGDALTGTVCRAFRRTITSGDRTRFSENRALDNHFLAPNGNLNGSHFGQDNLAHRHNADLHEGLDRMQLLFGKGQAIGLRQGRCTAIILDVNGPALSKDPPSIVGVPVVHSDRYAALLGALVARKQRIEERSPRFFEADCLVVNTGPAKLLDGCRRLSWLAKRGPDGCHASTLVRAAKPTPLSFG